MKNSRSTADRVRPILQAMERSIESARRRRLHDHETPNGARPLPAEPAAPAPTTHESIPAYGSEPRHPDTGLPRRKARRKQPSANLHRFEGEYRAEAG